MTIYEQQVMNTIITTLPKIAKSLESIAKSLERIDRLEDDTDERRRY